MKVYARALEFLRLLEEADEQALEGVGDGWVPARWAYYALVRRGLVSRVATPAGTWVYRLTELGREFLAREVDGAAPDFP